MAPKRTKKNIAKVKSFDYSNLQLADVLCPVCHTILVEPVTLPCSHHFCLECFNGTVNNAALVCPLCRTRISSWLRKSRKANKLVNLVLWDTIKAKFAKQLDNPSLVEDELKEYTQNRSIIATPGEINKEYQIELAKQKDELLKEQEKESRASEELIRKICQEEENERLALQEKVKHDEEIAKQLAKENPEIKPCCSRDVCDTPKRGPLDAFLIEKSQKHCVETPKVYKPKFCSKTEVSKSKSSIIRKVMNKVSVSTNSKTNTIDKSFAKILEKNNYKPKVLFHSKTEKEKLLLESSTKTLQADFEREYGDVIKSEICFFKPLEVAPLTPPKKMAGKIIQSPIIRSIPVRPITLNTAFRIRSPTEELFLFNTEQRSSAFRRSLSFETFVSNQNNTKYTNSDDSESNNEKNNITDENENSSENSAFNSLPSHLEFFNSNSNKRKLIQSNGDECENDFIFDNSKPESLIKNGCSVSNKSNITLEDDVILQQSLLEQAILQEKKDREFAQKLQDELNKQEPKVYTLRAGASNRRSLNSNSRKGIVKTGSCKVSPRKRQSTIDELCMTSKKCKI